VVAGPAPEARASSRISEIGRTPRGSRFFAPKWSARPRIRFSTIRQSQRANAPSPRGSKSAKVRCASRYASCSTSMESSFARSAAPSRMRMKSSTRSAASAKSAS
jgi:hypothetical protein